MAFPIAGFFAALSPWIARFFVAKAGLLFASFLGRLGIVLATNELAIEPLVNLVVSKWATLPGNLQCWLGLFGVTKAASVMLSGMTLMSAKKLFFARSSS